jgi:hypothetical protein
MMKPKPLVPLKNFTVPVSIEKNLKMLLRQNAFAKLGGFLFKMQFFFTSPSNFGLWTVDRFAAYKQHNGIPPLKAA